MSIAVIAITFFFFILIAYAFSQRKRFMENVKTVKESFLDALRKAAPMPETFEGDVMALGLSNLIKDSAGELVRLRYTPATTTTYNTQEQGQELIHTTDRCVWAIETVLLKLSERGIHWEKVTSDGEVRVSEETNSMILRLWVGEEKERYVYIIIGDITYSTKNAAQTWVGNFNESELETFAHFNTCTVMYHSDMYNEGHPIKVEDFEQILKDVEVIITYTSMEPKTKIFTLRLENYNPGLDACYNFAGTIWSSDEKDSNFAGNFLGPLEFQQENLKKTFSGGRAYNVILQFLSARTASGLWSPTSLFFGGPTGTGKTTLMNTLAEWLNYHLPSVDVVLCQHTFFSYFDSPEKQPILQKAFRGRDEVILVFDDFDKVPDAQQILSRLSNLVDSPMIRSILPCVKGVLVCSNQDPLKSDAAISRKNRFLYIKVDNLDAPAARKVAQSLEDGLTLDNEYFNWEAFEEELAAFGGMSLSSITGYVVKEGNISLAEFDVDPELDEEGEAKASVLAPTTSQNHRRRKKKKKA